MFYDITLTCKTSSLALMKYKYYIKSCNSYYDREQKYDVLAFLVFNTEVLAGQPNGCRAQAKSNVPVLLDLIPIIKPYTGPIQK